MASNPIGDFICTLRKAKGLTQRELAEMIDVSDKAVSRWERSETAPDLSLIPVIADIFDVTSDELLRGQRVAARTENADYSQKSQKIIKSILMRMRGRLAYQSVISLALTVMGFITYFVCVLGFGEVPLGLGLSLVFMTAGIVCEAVFIWRASCTVLNDELRSDDVDVYKHSIVKWLSAVLFANIWLFFTVLFEWFQWQYNIYIFVNATIFAIAVAVVIFVPLSALTSHICVVKLHFSDTYANAARKNNKTKLIMLGMAVIIIIAVIAGYKLWAASTKLEPGLKFETFEEFKAFAEAEAFVDKTGEIVYKHDSIIKNSAIKTETLYDANGIDYSFVRNNDQISDYTYNDEDMTSFVVYTKKDQMRYINTLKIKQWVCTAVCIAGLLTMLVIYIVKVKKYYAAVMHN